jgi:hypothetical protein
MISTAFDASVTSGHDYDEALVLVAFADDPVKPSRYLLLQRSLEPDDQDRALGHNTYHVEWCGQERSIYGGIEAFTLSGAGAHVRFAPEAAEALGGLTDLTITFELSPGEFAALGRDVEALFADSGCLIRANA